MTKPAVRYLEEKLIVKDKSCEPTLANAEIMSSKCSNVHYHDAPGVCDGTYCCP